MKVWKGSKSFVIQSKTTARYSSSKSSKGRKKVFIDFIGTTLWAPREHGVGGRSQGRDWRGVNGRRGRGGSRCVWGMAGCQPDFAKGLMDGGR